MTFEAKLVASATIFICKRSKTKVVLSFPFNSCESVYKFLYVIIRKSNPALLAISYGAIVLVAKRNSPPFWLTSGESSARKSTTELSICFQQKAEDPFQSSVPKRFLTEFLRCCCKCYCEINLQQPLTKFSSSRTLKSNDSLRSPGLFKLVLQFDTKFRWRHNRELKQRRFWATHVNRKLPFFIFGRWFCPNFQSNRLYKSKETKQYKLHSVKAYYKGKVLTSGWRPLLKNVFA